jgi:hypothetical protein
VETLYISVMYSMIQARASSMRLSLTASFLLAGLLLRL